MELVDTHAHLNFPAFEKDLEEVIKTSLAEGVTTIINVGTDLPTSKTSIELAEKYNFIFATAGIHPTDSPDINIEKEVTELKKLVEQHPVVAVGECGLDFYRQENKEERKRQIELFEKQVDIAKKEDLPLIVHSREAWPETLEIVKDSGLKKGVFHSWTYNEDITREALKETDFYFAFNGIVTFKNALFVQESAKLIPQDRLLLETDCPFLSPHPKRGLRNEPVNVRIVAELLADLKNTTQSEIAQITTQNAKNIFNL